MERVYKTTPGIRFEPGYLPSGGVPVEQWRDNPDLVDRPSNEMRQETCPSWWYNTANQRLHPLWTECFRANTFAKCPSFGQKDKCWERWDQQYVPDGRTTETLPERIPGDNEC